MRIAALVAVPLLVAGCSHTVGGGSGQTSRARRHRDLPDDDRAAVGQQTAGAVRAGAGRRGARSLTSSPGSRRVIPPIRAAITARRATASPRRSVTTSRSPPHAGQSHLHDGFQAHRRRAGVPGRPDQSPAPARRRPTANGRAAGSTSTEPTCRSGRPAPIRVRSSTATDPNWRTGTRCHSATTVAAPTKPGCSA